MLFFHLFCFLFKKINTTQCKFPYIPARNTLFFIVCSLTTKREAGPGRAGPSRLFYYIKIHNSIVFICMCVLIIHLLQLLIKRSNPSELRKRAGGWGEFKKRHGHNAKFNTLESITNNERMRGFCAQLWNHEKNNIKRIL
jgi:hypothetical protein